MPIFHKDRILTSLVVEGSAWTGVLSVVLCTVGAVVSVRTDVGSVPHHRPECGITKVTLRTHLTVPATISVLGVEKYMHIMIFFKTTHVTFIISYRKQAFQQLLTIMKIRQDRIYKHSNLQ